MDPLKQVEIDQIAQIEVYSSVERRKIATQIAFCIAADRQLAYEAELTSCGSDLAELPFYRGRSADAEQDLRDRVCAVARALFAEIAALKGALSKTNKRSNAYAVFVARVEEREEKLRGLGLDAEGIATSGALAKFSPYTKPAYTLI